MSSCGAGLPPTARLAHPGSCKLDPWPCGRYPEGDESQGGRWEPTEQGRGQAPWEIRRGLLGEPKRRVSPALEDRAGSPRAKAPREAVCCPEASWACVWKPRQIPGLGPWGRSPSLSSSVSRGCPAFLLTVRVRDQRRSARVSQPTRGTPPPPALLCLVQSDKQGIWGHRELGSPLGYRMCSLEHPNSPGP